MTSAAIPPPWVLEFVLGFLRAASVAAVVGLAGASGSWPW